jgi:transcriptional regulator with XRE-family HTH domain
VTGEDAYFGTRLRYWRLLGGLSLSQLGAKVHLSKGQLSKIERGAKPPAVPLAKRCDLLLKTGGELENLARSELMTHDGEPSSSLLGRVEMDRRGALSVTAGLIAAAAGSGRSMRVVTADPSARMAFEQHFTLSRQLGQRAGPALVLPTVVSHAQLLADMAKHAQEPARTDLLLLAARHAEYAGWMHQEAGNDAAATQWTDIAVGWARAVDHDELQVHGLIRRGLIALYRGDATETVALAQHAGSYRKAPTALRSYAAQREAQGHAMAGNYDACMRSLDRARAVHDDTHQPAPGTSRTTNGATPLALGTIHVADPLAMVTGWCLHDLGRYGEAARILDTEVDKLPEDGWRSQARYGVRQALAHAEYGDVEKACQVIDRLWRPIQAVDSATIDIDLRALSHILSRRRAHPSVERVYPQLTTSLRIA